MTDVIKNELLEFVDKLPGFSAAVLKIISLSNDPKSSPTDLVAAVSMDPMLTAKLLRLVNSAYYSPSQAISSLNRAVIMLGFNTIKNMALSVAVVSSINIKDSFKWFSNEQFWEHSLSCAIASRTLAKATKAGALEVEEFFVAGLLHDMGRAALIQRYSEECERIYDPESVPLSTFYEREIEEFDISHAQLGAVIARHWKLPESLCMAIERHHDPLSLDVNGKEGRLAITVHIADQYSHKLKIGIQNSGNLGNISNEVWASFKLKPEEADASLSDLEQGVIDAKDFLQDIESK